MLFHMPARLYFGSGEIVNLKPIVDTYLKADNPVLVTDKGIVASGLIEKVVSQFSGIKIFDEIEANPKSDTINKIAGEMREISPDLVIGLGGGSPLDAGKALALLR